MADNFYERAASKIMSYAPLCIESEYGLRLLAGYLHELELASKGVPYKALSMSERRKNSASILLVNQDGQSSRGEKISAAQAGAVAVFTLSGIMTASSDMSHVGVDYLERQIRAAYSSSEIDALVIETNSGGGESIAMQMLVGAIRDRNKPVIGYGHYAASAAYGTIAEADEIIASSPMSMFGSVGAVISVDKRALEFLKENILNFYGESAPNKQEEFRAMLQGDFSKIQNLVDKASDAFQKQILQARGLDPADEKTSETLSGRMFFTSEAKKRGLVDGMGTLNYAVQRARFWAKKHKNKTA